MDTLYPLLHPRHVIVNDTLTVRGFIVNLMAAVGKRFEGLVLCPRHGIKVTQRFIIRGESILDTMVRDEGSLHAVRVLEEIFDKWRRDYEISDFKHQLCYLRLAVLIISWTV